MGKKKKEKIIYVDDGRTIADMSAVRSGRITHRKGFGQGGASFKDVWHTYWGAVRMMFLPMLAVILGLIIVYLIMTLLFAVM